MKNRNTGCEEFPNCFCVYFCRIFLVGCVSVRRQSVSIRAVQTESCLCPLRPTRPITSAQSALSAVCFELFLVSILFSPSSLSLPLVISWHPTFSPQIILAFATLCSLCSFSLHSASRKTAVVLLCSFCTWTRFVGVEVKWEMKIRTEGERIRLAGREKREMQLVVLTETNCDWMNEWRYELRAEKRRGKRASGRARKQKSTRLFIREKSGRLTKSEEGGNFKIKSRQTYKNLIDWRPIAYARMQLFVDLSTRSSNCLSDSQCIQCNNYSILIQE